MSFTIGSLFDGSGGFPLAAFLCGGVPVWASEIEPYPIAVTRSRFPHMKHLGSVTDIKGNEIDPVDVITFGSPCQDLSVAGKRAGLKHETNGDDETTRSGLFMEAVRIIREMREATNGEYPKFAVWENVPGAFSSNKGEDFRLVLEELIKICDPRAVMPSVPRKGWAYADSYRGDGWSLAYRVFDAQYWGVPQRRRRIYLVLDLTGQRARQVLFERDGLRGYFAEGRSPWEEITSYATRSTGADGNAGSNSGALTFVGLDVYNQTLTGNKAKTLNSAASDADHIPCVVGVMGFDMYNQQSTGEVSRTLKTPVGGDDLPVVCVKRYDARGGDGDTVLTITGDHENRITDRGSVVVECCIDGDKIGKAERSGGSGLGIRPGDKMYTLTAKDAGQHAVAYCTDVGWLSSAEEQSPTLLARQYKDPHLVSYPVAFGVDCRNMNETPELYPTSQAKDNGGQSLNYSGAVRIRYIVRRLTPTECARLQGFADDWAVPEHKDAFSDEEYTFWLVVRNTHAEINGKQTKDYTRDQMLRWYNKLHTDSSEYKLWGNGIALPCALYVMQGITDTFERA